MFFFTLCTLLAFAKEEGSPQASESPSRRHGTSLGIGSLGYSFSYIYAAKSYAISARYHSFPVAKTHQFDDIGSYKDLTNLTGASLLLHAHPFRAKWSRISAGVVYNMTTINIEKSGANAPVGSAENRIDLSENPLEASVYFNKIVPYIAWGTGMSNKKGLGFFLDLGMMYQGSATVNFTDHDLVTPEDINIETAVLEEHYTNQDILRSLLHFGVTYMF
jgi:hypothetical protein